MVEECRRVEEVVRVFAVTCSGERPKKAVFNSAGPLLLFSYLHPPSSIVRLHSYCTLCHSFSLMFPVLFLESLLTPVAF